MRHYLTAVLYFYFLTCLAFLLYLFTLPLDTHLLLLLNPVLLNLALHMNRLLAWAWPDDFPSSPCLPIFVPWLPILGILINCPRREDHLQSHLRNPGETTGSKRLCTWIRSCGTSAFNPYKDFRRHAKYRRWHRMQNRVWHFRDRLGCSGFTWLTINPLLPTYIYPIFLSQIRPYAPNSLGLA